MFRYKFPKFRYCFFGGQVKFSLLKGTMDSVVSVMN
uniref:Uncharacterized protein n=1 Tax=Arundo donax TaxID=35708 RepID=A0A0A9AMQ6_ARUDO